jgi:hypothetical protein
LTRCSGPHEEVAAGEAKACLEPRRFGCSPRARDPLLTRGAERYPCEPSGRRTCRAPIRTLLVGCLLAIVIAGPGEAAEQPRREPRELLRAYPLTETVEESPARTPAAGTGPESGRRAVEAPDSGLPLTAVGLGAVALGVLLGGGGVVLVRRRRTRSAAALAAPLSAPAKRSPPKAATPTAGAGGAPAKRTASRHPTPLVMKSCWVVCCRAEGDAVFRAVARDQEGRQCTLGESPAFPQPTGAPVVLQGVTLEALETLTAQLIHDGWDVASPTSGGGGTWHAREFRRTVPADRRDRREDDDHLVR